MKQRAWFKPPAGLVLAACLVLAGVPIRADVAIGSVEDRQYLGAVERRQLVAAGYVAVQLAIYQFHRQVIDDGTILALHDHRGKRMRAQQRVHDIGAVFNEGCGRIHRALLSCQQRCHHRLLHVQAVLGLVDGDAGG